MNTFDARRFAWLGVLGLFAGCAALLVARPAAADEKNSGDAALAGDKESLSAENYSRLLAVVRPHQNEWRHLRVHWLTDVVAARRRAAAEDKPIIICYTGGAGYNEPLGVC